MKLLKFLYIAILFSLPSYSFAQQDTVLINEVIINDDKPSTFLMSGNRLVQVITKEEVENLPVRSVNDLLEYAINVDVRNRGSDEVQSDISLRGGSVEQTLILLNGVRMNDPQTGHHNMDLPVEISQVERIEILEGSGARQYGANAFCGIINIVTDQPDKSFLNLGVVAGMYDRYEGVLSGGFAAKKSSHFLSVSGKTCSGYTENTDYNVWKGYYSGSFYRSIGTYSFQAGYLDKAFGANSFYTPKYPDQFEHTKTLFTSLQFASSGKVKITPQVYWRRHHDRFELFRYENETPSWYKNHNYHLTDVLGSNVNVQFNNALGKTGIKAEYYLENILSNVLGKPIDDTITDHLDPSGYFTKSDMRNNVSLSAEHQYIKSSFSFSLGLLANYNEDYGFGIYPGIDLSYEFKPWVKWYFAANKSFRVPTFTDLYYQGPTNKGNPDLQPEKAYSFENGLKFTHNGFFAHIAGFYRLGKDIIDWVKLPDSSKWESANITELDTWGLETSARIPLEELLEKKCPITRIDVSYSFVNSIKNSGPYISYYVMDYIKHKFNIDINVRIYKKIGVNLAFSYSDRNGTYTDYAEGIEKNYEGFTVTDIKLFWRPLNFEMYLSCNNVFDTHYNDFGNINMPGRWILGGLNYKFNFTKKTNKHD